MIVVFGSINLDLILAVPELPRPGQTVLGESYFLAPGGKGANQALAAARDGAQVAMIGSVGRDSFAELALADLSREGVDLRHLRHSDLATGCAAVTVARNGENQIAVALGANLAATGEQIPQALLTPATTLVLQMEVTPRETASAIRRARDACARTVLNYAPAEDPKALPQDVLALVDVLVLNEIEAAGISVAYGIPVTDAPKMATSLAAKFGATIVITLGGDGAIAAATDQAWRVAALPITAVDTTGAGDAFVGGRAAAREGGAALPAALHRASAAAGLACLVRGAQPSLPHRTEIERALQGLAPPEVL
ncbi:MAG TPA: ribokinase [Candidatus Cybelea sp.]|nr:ribokinase [Candidatus Cybelea sp.]